MGEFNRAICLSNIQFLAKQKGVPMGELETDAGVSVGYFSRLMKPDASACPSVDVVWRIAQRFGVSVDTLVSADLRRQSAADHYKQKFLQKLTQDTEAAQWNDNSKLDWHQFSAHSLYVWHFLRGDYKLHFPEEPDTQPLPESWTTDSENPPESEEHVEIVRCVPKLLIDNWDLDPGSSFDSWDPKASEEVFLDDEILSCDLSSGGYVYVVRVRTGGAQDARTDIELYMETEEEKEFVCSTRNEFLAGDLTDLEAVARAAANNRALSEPIRSAINKYMETD